MYSTRCTYCHQLITLKTDEVRDAIAASEAKNDNLYSMHCPKCRRLLKIQVKDLKRKLPVEFTLPTPGEKHEEEETSVDEETPTP